jgi:hypothetical protein
MIRITVCEAAFEAIANTLLRGSAAIEPEVNARGVRARSGLTESGDSQRIASRIQHAGWAGGWQACRERRIGSSPAR